MNFADFNGCCGMFELHNLDGLDRLPKMLRVDFTTEDVEDPEFEGYKEVLRSYIPRTRKEFFVDMIMGMYNLDYEEGVLEYSDIGADMGFDQFRSPEFMHDCDTIKPGHLLMATAEIKRQAAVIKILDEIGFAEVKRFRNPNSKNMVGVFIFEVPGRAKLAQRLYIDDNGEVTSVWPPKVAKVKKVPYRKADSGYKLKKAPPISRRSDWL